MSAGCFKWCLKGFWRVPRECREGVWKVFGGYLNGVWRLVGGCLQGIWKVSDSARYKECAWRVSKILDQNSLGKIFLDH